jgi:hypothetical protein
MNQIEKAYAECRSLGHEWRKGKPIATDGIDWGSIGIPSMCPNCGTTKVRTITRSGESKTRYDYPDGYSRHGDEVLSVKEWRHAYIETIFESFERQVLKKQGQRKSA